MSENKTEYYVKWKGKTIEDCEWISKSLAEFKLGFEKSIKKWKRKQHLQSLEYRQGLQQKNEVVVKFFIGGYVKKDLLEYYQNSSARMLDGIGLDGEFINKKDPYPFQTIEAKAGLPVNDKPSYTKSMKSFVQQKRHEKDKHYAEKKENNARQMAYDRYQQQRQQYEQEKQAMIKESKTIQRKKIINGIDFYEHYKSQTLSTLTKETLIMYTNTNKIWWNTSSNNTNKNDLIQLVKNDIKQYLEMQIDSDND